MALPSFSRVNDIVSVYSPSTDGSTTPGAGLRPSKAQDSKVAASPQTILLLSWGDASPRLIAKYTTLYKEIFPTARIILVQSGMADFLWRPESTQTKLSEPAVKMLAETSPERLLVHVMSNAGSKRWCTINESYVAATGQSLGSAVTIMDSAPGRATWEQTMAALSGSLPKATVPRMVLGFLIGSFLFVMHFGKYLLPWPNPLELTMRRMNDPGPQGAKPGRRCYIYSEKDEVIGWKDVEEHAKEAREKGWAVEMIKFQGSTHVGHFRQDPVRYREVIEKTWLGERR